MPAKDWFFKEKDFVCGFRSVGVLVRDNKILVQKNKNGDEYALPGGHVKIGETSQVSLVREYKEETGADIICDRLIWVDESFWTWLGERRAHHSVLLPYIVKKQRGHSR